MSKLTRVLSVALFPWMAAASQAQDNTAPPRTFPAAPEHDLVVRVCGGCHVPEMITSKRHTAEEWDDIIARMVDHGAQANEAQQEQILAYLLRFYGKQ